MINIYQTIIIALLKIRMVDHKNLSDDIFIESKIVGYSCGTVIM